MNLLRSALVPLCAALCAALAAHWAIDVVGDYLLPHDPFDDVAHGSRPVAAGVALALVTVAACGVVWAAVREARGSDDAFCAGVAALLPRRFWAFAALVAIGSLGLVAVMEACDVALAGTADVDLVELLGASPALGAALTLLASLAVSSLAWRAVRLLARKRRTFIALASVLLRRHSTGSAAAPIARRAGRRIALRAVASRRVRAGRAPPSSAFAGTIS